MSVLWLAPLAVPAFVLAALLLNGFEARATARRAAADEERRRREERDERDARARAQESQDDERSERVYLIVGGGLRRWLEHLQLDEAIATRVREAQQRALRETADRLAGVVSRCHAALPQRNRVWAIVGAIVLGLVWIVAGVTNLFLDVEVFRGIGHDLQLALPLAVLLVLGLTVAGVVLTDLIGFTHVLPGVEGLSRRVRIALPAGIAAALCICVSQLPSIVQNRSADVAADVRRDETQLTLLRNAHAPDDLVRSAQSKVEASRARLKAARDADAGLAIVAAGIEIATSWAAIWLGLLGTAEIAKRRADQAKRAAAALELESAGAEDRIRRAVLTRVQELQMTDDEVRLAFAAPPHGTDPGSEPPPMTDGPTSDGPAGPGSDDEDHDTAEDRTRTETSGPFEPAF
jgi:hypothetical protein